MKKYIISEELATAITAIINQLPVSMALEVANRWNKELAEQPKEEEKKG